MLAPTAQILRLLTRILTVEYTVTKEIKEIRVQISSSILTKF